MIPWNCSIVGMGTFLPNKFLANPRRYSALGRKGAQGTKISGRNGSSILSFPMGNEEEGPGTDISLPNIHRTILLMDSKWATLGNNYEVEQNHNQYFD